MKVNEMVTQETWLEAYFNSYRDKLLDKETSLKLLQLKQLVEEVKRKDKKVIFVGNGGSAAIASHSAIDFTKQAGVRAICFNEASLITCLANDYGYENWVAKAIELYADTEDLIILISSSGKSKNIINGAVQASQQGNNVVTFTGFEQNNPLRLLGKLNFWLDSKVYNIVENIHLMWILSISDILIEPFSG